MPRNTLNRQLNMVQDEILILGSMVEQATRAAVGTLKSRDLREAKLVFEQDQIINEKRFAIENAILILMATQQPMARDLRTLAALLEVNTELERMGDYAKGIAKVTLRMGNAEVNLPMVEINQMAELAVGMLHRALGAFIEENANLAVAIPKEDDRIDELFNTAYSKILHEMVANPSTIDNVNLALWVIHNLERMADRVSNICERTVFIATGELFEMDGMDEEDLNV
ncbi:MAG: phosphate transport system regulatory protein PhoU [Anaerolinea sp.]|nr:phosphate transport system regulatory protein PhoU [Anaerolinea sp.]